MAKPKKSDSNNLKIEMVLHQSYKLISLLVLQVSFLFYLIRCNSLPYKTKTFAQKPAHSHTKNYEKIKKSYTNHKNSVIESQELTYLLTKLESSSVNAGSDDEFDDDFEEVGEFEIYDPWEPMNRFFFSFNDFLFVYGLNPLAQINAFLLPRSIRTGISNFLTHLGMPVRMFSSLIQGKFVKAGLEVSNFLINSVLGFGGLFNASRDWFDIYVDEEDFGQAFGFWGIPPGPHLEVPFFGAFNLRDAFGFGIDSIVSPRSWIISFVLLPDTVLVSRVVSVGIFVHKIVNNLSLRLGEYEELKENAIDPYILFRDIYEQHRKRIIEE